MWTCKCSSQTLSWEVGGENQEGLSIYLKEVGNGKTTLYVVSGQGLISCSSLVHLKVRVDMREDQGKQNQMVDKKLSLSLRLRLVKFRRNDRIRKSPLGNHQCSNCSDNDHQWMDANALCWQTASGEGLPKISRCLPTYYLFLIEFLCLEAIIDLYALVRNKRERSCAPFMQFPLKVTSFKTMAQYHSQDTDNNTVLQYYLDSHFNWTHVCVPLHVCGSRQFQHFPRFVY